MNGTRSGAVPFLTALLLAVAATGCSGGSTAPVPAASVVAEAVLVVPVTSSALSLPPEGTYGESLSIVPGAQPGTTVSVAVTLPSAAVAAAAPYPFLVQTATFSQDVPAGVVATETLTNSGVTFDIAKTYYCDIVDLTTRTFVGQYGGLGATAFPFAVAGRSSGPAFSAGHVYQFQFSYQLDVGSPAYVGN